MKDPAASSTASAKRRHVDSIVAVLARHAQRATYGAVGGVVGLPARSVMSGCARTPANSFVVSAKAGVPTGYAGSECDPALKSRAGVIDTATALSHWLGQRT